MRTISNVLAALERISRNPPPALMVDPSDALGSARGAILISAILPQLQEKADRGDRRPQAAHRDQGRGARRGRAAQGQLRNPRRRAVADRDADRRPQAGRVETVTAELAAGRGATPRSWPPRRSSLKELIASLTARANAVATAAEATAGRQCGRHRAQARRRDHPRRARQHQPGRTGRPLRTRPAATSSCPRAASTVVEYGAGDGFGGIAQGISIVTRAEAQVVAPADGWVLYKGDYLNYGQIVILNAGQDYTILLAGLANVTVDIGQFVLMGEPVGTMGSRTIGQTVDDQRWRRPTHALY